MERVLFVVVKTWCTLFSRIQITLHITGCLQYLPLISGFHRALLQPTTFISRLNAHDYTKLRGQNPRCIKIFKIHKIKNHSDMFRIVCDPSSGGIELYLTEIRNGSLMFVVCLVGVWQRNFEPAVYVYGRKV